MSVNIFLFVIRLGFLLLREAKLFSARDIFLHLDCSFFYANLWEIVLINNGLRVVQNSVFGYIFLFFFEENSYLCSRNRNEHIQSLHSRGKLFLGCVDGYVYGDEFREDFNVSGEL